MHCHLLTSCHTSRMAGLKVFAAYAAVYNDLSDGRVRALHMPNAPEHAIVIQPQHAAQLGHAWCHSTCRGAVSSRGVMVIS